MYFVGGIYIGKVLIKVVEDLFGLNFVWLSNVFKILVVVIDGVFMDDVI